MDPVDKIGTGEPLTPFEETCLLRLIAADGEVVPMHQLMFNDGSYRRCTNEKKSFSPSSIISRLQGKLGSRLIDGKYELRETESGRRHWMLVGWSINRNPLSRRR